MDTFLLNQVIYDVNPGTLRATVLGLAERMGALHLLDVPIRKLSHGERMKMEFIACVAHRPRLLLLDEPTLGLDLQTQRSLRQTIASLAREWRVTVLLSSHNLDDIRETSHRTILLSHGNIVHDGSTHDLVARTGLFRRIRVTLPPGRQPDGSRLASFARDSAALPPLVSVNDVNATIAELLLECPEASVSVEQPEVEDVILHILHRTA
jgi:ABC-2 type transport system ATP-binding protein